MGDIVSTIYFMIVIRIPQPGIQIYFIGNIFKKTLYLRSATNYVRLSFFQTLADWLYQPAPEETSNVAIALNLSHPV